MVITTHQAPHLAPDLAHIGLECLDRLTLDRVGLKPLAQVGRSAAVAQHTAEGVITLEDLVRVAWPWQRQLKGGSVVVSLFRGRFLAQPATSRKNVRLRPEQVGHWGHEYRNPLTCFRFDEVEKVIQ